MAGSTGKEVIMNIKNTVTELIGDTPLLRLKKMEERFGARGEIVAKVELFNPAGSIKDRVGYNMIIEAEKSGRLKPGGTIIKLLAALGAELVLTDKSLGMKGSLEKADQLAREIPGSIIAGQFENPANPQAHYETTAPEIWRDTDGKLDVFVSAFGTGGTVTGVGRYLKEKDPSVRIVGVEPAASPLVTEGKAAPHKIQGIGANFVPDVLDVDIMDEIITVTDDDALDTMKELARTEGLLTGVSSGAALYAAGQVAAREENTGKRIVVVLPDTGERYLSIF